MPRCPCMDNMAKSFPFTLGSPLQLRHKWTAKTHQPAIFYIWPDDIDECRLVGFSHVASFWIKLNRFQSGCMLYFKCWTFGHMAFNIKQCQFTSSAPLGAGTASSVVAGSVATSTFLRLPTLFASKIFLGAMLGTCVFDAAKNHQMICKDDKGSSFRIFTYSKYSCNPLAIFIYLSETFKKYLRMIRYGLCTCKWA